MIYYSLFAPYLLIFLDNKHHALRKLFLLIWLPALIAGLTTGWASRNGWPNMAVGILPGALITTLLLVTVISEAIEKISHSATTHYFALIPASVLALMLFYSYGSIYGDGMGKMSRLTEKVEVGPYQGLYTTSERKEFISTLSQNLQRFIRKNDKRILFYDFFAAGYLFSSLRPASTTVWEISLGTYSNVNRDSIMAYYKNKNNWPDIVVKMKTGFNPNGWTGPLNDARDDPLNRFINQSYRRVFNGKDYSIFRMKFK
ncbi:membrane protein [Beggiatoa sp. PS]|nr:membrane protein [Beggiatoa sp. PS]